PGSQGDLVRHVRVAGLGVPGGAVSADLHDGRPERPERVPRGLGPAYGVHARAVKDLDAVPEAAGVDGHGQSRARGSGRRSAGPTKRPGRVRLSARSRSASSTALSARSRALTSSGSLASYGPSLAYVSRVIGRG